MNRVEILYNGVERTDKDKKIRLLCSRIFDIMEIKNWELSVVVCDDNFIRELNRNYKGKDEPTDVLSFPQAGFDFKSSRNKKHYAGDIIISVESLAKNSGEFNVDINEEFSRLLIHGILHLKGYIHEDNSPQQDMLKLQEDLIKMLPGEKIF